MKEQGRTTSTVPQQQAEPQHLHPRRETQLLPVLSQDQPSLNGTSSVSLRRQTNLLPAAPEQQSALKYQSAPAHANAVSHNSSKSTELDLDTINELPDLTANTLYAAEIAHLPKLPSKEEKTLID